MPNVLDRAYQEVTDKLGPWNGGPSHGVPDVPIQEEWHGIDDIDPASHLGPLDPGGQADTGSVDGVGQEPLDGEERRWIDGGIRERGIEALAFYKSFRFVSSPPFVGYWGVFYLDLGIRRVRELMAQYGPDHGDGRSLAVEFLRRHERAHFKFDVYALGIESALSKHLYQPLKQAFRGRQIFQVEEAFANHEAWRWAQRQGDPVRNFAEEFMDSQPGAYARFREDRRGLASELAANLIDLNFSSGARRDDQDLWVANLPTAMAHWQSYCREYLVSGANVLSRWINPAWKLPAVTAIQDSHSVLKMLEGRYAGYRDKWEKTKSKLIQEPGLRGLRFKLWDAPTGTWSVRVDDNFRAHLVQIRGSNGMWETCEFGDHKAMGHG